MIQNKILVVEDQPHEREALCRLLRSEGFNVASAASRLEAMAFMDDSIQLIISDLRLGNESGLQLLREIRAERANLPIIVVTAYGDISTAVQAMKMGAFDFLTKPVDPSVLLTLIRQKLSEEGSLASDRSTHVFNGMIGTSMCMQNVYERIRRASEVDCNVLITGETGTGKELVAESLHKNGKRRDKPYLATNISAIPVGLLEAELFGVAKGAYTDAYCDREGVLVAADKGTLFLDEVGELPLTIQPKLLRVLEGAPISAVGSRELKKVDVRFVFATHRNLHKMVSSDQFRSDLWHRMSVLVIDLPPLRERREDLPLLVDSFLEEFCLRHNRPRPEIEGQLECFIRTYDWPGNIRQLKNAIESMIVMHRGMRLTMEDLSHFLKDEAPSVSALNPMTSLQDYEQMAIMDALKSQLGNRTAAAQKLGISVRTLQRKLKRWALGAPPEGHCDK